MHVQLLVVSHVHYDGARFLAFACIVTFPKRLFPFASPGLENICWLPPGHAFPSPLIFSHEV